jgi:hypothetical protein
MLRFGEGRKQLNSSSSFSNYFVCSKCNIFMTSYQRSLNLHSSRCTGVSTKKQFGSSQHHSSFNSSFGNISLLNSTSNNGGSVLKKRQIDISDIEKLSPNDSNNPSSFINGIANMIDVNNSFIQDDGPFNESFQQPGFDNEDDKYIENPCDYLLNNNMEYEDNENNILLFEKYITFQNRIYNILYSHRQNSTNSNRLNSSTSSYNSGLIKVLNIGWTHNINNTANGHPDINDLLDIYIYILVLICFQQPWVMVY